MFDNSSGHYIEFDFKNTPVSSHELTLRIREAQNPVQSVFIGLDYEPAHSRYELGRNRGKPQWDIPYVWCRRRVLRCGKISNNNQFVSLVILFVTVAEHSRLGDHRLLCPECYHRLI